MVTNRTDKRCGTNAGYLAHRRRGEAACHACKRAHRMGEAARTRAFTRLAHLYPADFRRLVAEEREAES